MASARARLADALRGQALLCSCPISASECQFLKDTAELCCKVLGPAHPDTVLAVCALSAYFVGHGSAGKAEDVLKEPLEAVTETHGPGLYNTLVSVDAWCFFCQGESCSCCQSAKRPQGQSVNTKKPFGLQWRIILQGIGWVLLKPFG